MQNGKGGPGGARNGDDRSETSRYVNLFERAPVGYMLLDDDGCIRRINRAGAAMLGWTARWLEGKPFYRWVMNNDKPLFETHRRSLQEADGCARQEIRVKNRHGRVISLQLHSTRDDDRGCRSVMIDISGEQESARRLRRLQAQLAHAGRMYAAGELASSLAHELNQPLGTVVLNCEMARRLLESGQEAKDEIAEALGEAAQAASFASDVIRHLRSFLRKNAEQHTVCALPVLIADVATLIETDTRDNNVELNLDIEPDMPRVRLDPVQIEQVIVNLTHNSVEAMAEGASGGSKAVTIRARGVGRDQVRITVEDNGPGLTPEQLDRVFDPFYTTKSEGMGMGLSISRTIVEAHGGRLWAEPGAEPGARLHLTLPVIREDRRAE